MPSIIVPSGFNNSGLEVVLSCPNSKLLTEDWWEIMRYVNSASSKNEVIRRLIRLSKDYGEINRGYSKNLPNKYFLVLQKRMTEIERITRYIVKNTPRLKKEFREALKSIRANFSGVHATHVKRSF